jgi:outer membrane protein TolC
MTKAITSLLKHSLIFTLLALPAITSFAQSQPASQTRSNLSKPSAPLSDSAFEERLVQLALGGPQYDVVGHQVKIAEYKVKAAKLSWFNLLTLSLNYNDQTFAHQPAVAGGTTAYVYPKFFFGLVIPIGTIVTKGSEIKAAREDVRIAQDNQLLMARQIRAEVLTKYAQYRNYRDQAVLETQLVDDLSAGYTQIEKKFRDGTVTLEAFSAASRGFNEESARKLTIQLQVEISKYELERIIGVRLETVAH